MEVKKYNLVIDYLLNRDTGEKTQYVGFEYTKVNGIYGYLGVDYNNNVIFIYIDGSELRKDVLNNYNSIKETIQLR